MRQTPPSAEEFSQLVARVAREEIDLATDRFMRKCFKLEVGPEIGVALLMKACVARLGETEEGQKRLERYLAQWAEQVTFNRTLGRPLRSIDAVRRMQAAAARGRREAGRPMADDPILRVDATITAAAESAMAEVPAQETPERVRQHSEPGELDIAPELDLRSTDGT